MHSALRLWSVIIPVFAMTGACYAQAPLPGTDIRSYLTADITSKLSFGGTWIPVDTANGALVGPYWNVVKLGPSQREGVALGGWVFNGSFASANANVTPVRAALLEQQSNGTLVDATLRLLGNPITNGAGSVIVADFNGDGLDDIVFPAHNESPFLYQHSTAWMSRAGGGFDKLTLADDVMNHDARLVTLDGQKKIFSKSFGGSGNNGNGAGFNVIYSWNGSTLVADTSLGDLGGQSVNAGYFTGNSDIWLVTGDSRGGPGVPYSVANPMQNYMYKYSAGVVSLPPVLLPKPYFNDKPAYAGFRSFWDPSSKSHTSRIWSTDLNQDGLPDLLAGTEIWDPQAGLQKSVFQLLVNRGNTVFTDETDALAPEYSQDSSIDYSVRFADVDASGIETMFHASTIVFADALDVTKQGQYVLVNDGTGRLYAAMHDEFRAMRTQVVQFFNRNIPAGGASVNLTPQFIAYRSVSGKLNFLAVVKYFVPNATPNVRYGFVSVALEVDLATDFRRDLTIPTRNGSKRIRTFAGNDTIGRAVSDPDCSIDGGLGTNTVVYPGNRSAWVIAKAGDKVTVRPASGPGGTDTLTRIQRARFDDQTVDLLSLSIPTATNYTALWWNPAESGWGVNFNHQGDIVFATLFTYDAAGAPLWLVMSAGALQSGTTYSGDLYLTTGPAFNAAPFTPITANNLTKVGTMTAAFSAADAATLRYTVNGTTVTKTIQKQVFGSPTPNCVPTTAGRGSLTNYQDLWWNASESGWGINIAHQGNTIFATLFTYAANGRGLWLVMSGGTRQSDGSYLGDLYQTTGPAFNAIPFTPIGSANVTKVGTMRLQFSDGQTGTLTYSVNGANVTKQITRQVFSTPVFACS